VKEKAHYTVDVRGTISPFSLLKVSLVFQKMKPREVMEILGCDEEMQQDLLRLLPEAAFEVVPMEGKKNNSISSTLRCCKRKP
jgi:TusA-related sulfurtransferase